MVKILEIFEIFIGVLTKDLNISNFILNLSICSCIVKFICHLLFLFLNPVCVSKNIHQLKTS